MDGITAGTILDGTTDGTTDGAVMDMVGTTLVGIMVGVAMAGTTLDGIMAGALTTHGDGVATVTETAGTLHIIMVMVMDTEATTVIDIITDTVTEIMLVTAQEEVITQEAMLQILLVELRDLRLDLVILEEQVLQDTEAQAHAPRTLEEQHQEVIEAEALQADLLA